MILEASSASSKDFEKLVGNLVWASYVEPWGRPFLAAISCLITRAEPSTRHRLCRYTRMALIIWLHILRTSAGVSFQWILSALPKAQDAWFVDASTSWGIGGCAGRTYFTLPNYQLTSLFSLYHSGTHRNLMGIPKSRLPIAYIELIAVLVGFSVFAKNYSNQLVTIYSDNTDVVSWLRSSRCSAGIGFRLLAAIEFFKRVYNLKISARHIPGKHNMSADILSRGSIPDWLTRDGCRQPVNVKYLFHLINEPLQFWTKI